MEKIFALINQMEADGVIGRYAIGGAVGAIFWLELSTTRNIDVFVGPPRSQGGTLLSLGPIYEYLTAKGCETRAEYVIIEGWPVQFVPPGTPLVEEALAEAVERDVDGVSTRVFTAEHLAAICLQVGRDKDHYRLAKFIEDGMFDPEKFDAILRRHGLLGKWREFRQSHPTKQP